MTFDISDLMDEEMPFHDQLGLEVVEVGDDGGTVRMNHAEHLCGIGGSGNLHGGAISSLADAAGGFAIIANNEAPCPTVDLRLDYLQPATTDLVATGTIVHNGEGVGVTDIDVYDADGTLVATGRGTFKTGGDGWDSPWFVHPSDYGK